MVTPTTLFFYTTPTLFTPGHERVSALRHSNIVRCLVSHIHPPIPVPAVRDHVLEYPLHFFIVHREILGKTLRLRKPDQLHFQLVLDQNRSKLALLKFRFLLFRRLPGSREFDDIYIARRHRSFLLVIFFHSSSS